MPDVSTVVALSGNVGLLAVVIYIIQKINTLEAYVMGPQKTLIEEMDQHLRTIIPLVDPSKLTRVTKQLDDVKGKTRSAEQELLSLNKQLSKLLQTDNFKDVDLSDTLDVSQPPEPVQYVRKTPKNTPIATMEKGEHDDDDYDSDTEKAIETLLNSK